MIDRDNLHRLRDLIHLDLSDDDQTIYWILSRVETIFPGASHDERSDIALRVLGDLMREGLAVAGYVPSGGKAFEPLPESVEDTLTTFADALATGSVATWLSMPTFYATERGRELAPQVRREVQAEGLRSWIRLLRAYVDGVLPAPTFIDHFNTKWDEQGTYGVKGEVHAALRAIRDAARRYRPASEAHLDTLPDDDDELRDLAAHALKILGQELRHEYLS